MYPGTPTDFKKFYSSFSYFISIYSSYQSSIKFTREIAGNVCIQNEDIVKSMYTLVLIQHHVKRILKKGKLAIPKC